MGEPIKGPGARPGLFAARRKRRFAPFRATRRGVTLAAMSRLRPLAAILLAAMLAFGSGAMAVARGQATAAGAVVLCTGAGIVSVPVDLSGNPVGPAHICPDCALSLFAAYTAPPLELARPLTLVGSLEVRPPAPLPAGRTTTAYHARGPPILS